MELLIGLGLLLVMVMMAVAFARGKTSKRPNFLDLAGARGKTSKRPNFLDLAGARGKTSKRPNFLDLAGDHRYHSRALLNRSEQQVYECLQQLVSPRYRINMQTSMGEFLACKGSKQAYSAINSKRVDFLLVDKKSYMPIAVIEFHGKGHFEGNAKQRDAIKKAALSGSGIAYVAIHSNQEAEIARALQEYSDQ